MLDRDSLPPKGQLEAVSLIGSHSCPCHPYLFPLQPSSQPTVVLVLQSGPTPQEHRYLMSSSLLGWTTLALEHGLTHKRFLNRGVSGTHYSWKYRSLGAPASPGRRKSKTGQVLSPWQLAATH